MRNGSCGFGADCRFHHPDPTIGVRSDPHSSNPSDDCFRENWNNDCGPFELQRASQSTQMSQLLPVVSDSINSYLDNKFAYAMSLAPQGPSQNHESNQYQVDDFPQRPGQPECQYFMRTGSCKFKSACWYHHPKFHTSLTGLLSDKGLPLRPGKNICMHYEKYGFCKFGPACGFDHPMDHEPQPSQMGNRVPFTEI